jgi:hypothetical protein
MDLLLEAKLTPDQQKEFDQALAILKNDTLDEGIMDKLKKLGLSATVIAALLTSPQLTQAQKEPLKDLPKQPTTQTISTTKTNPNFWVKDSTDIKNVQTAIKAYKKYTLAQWKNNKGYIINTDKKYKDISPAERAKIEAAYMSSTEKTDVDGINGEITSNFIFPGAFLLDIKDKAIIAALGIEGNESLELLNKSGLTDQQMKDWNKYVEWMRKKGYAGNKKMNGINFSKDVLQQYKSAK